MGKIIKRSSGCPGTADRGGSRRNGIFLQENHETLQCKDRAYHEDVRRGLGKIFPAHA